MVCPLWLLARQTKEMRGLLYSGANNTSMSPFSAIHALRQLCNSVDLFLPESLDTAVSNQKGPVTTSSEITAIRPMPIEPLAAEDETGVLVLLTQTAFCIALS